MVLHLHEVKGFVVHPRAEEGRVYAHQILMGNLSRTKRTKKIYTRLPCYMITDIQT